MAKLDGIIRESALRVSPEKPFRLAVIPFTQTESQHYIDRGFAVFLTENITSTIGAIGSIQLYERSRLDAILHEQALAGNGLFNDTEMKRIGELAPIDYILTGTFTRLEKSISLNARFIDMLSGEVSSSFSGSLPMTSELDGLFGSK